MPTEPYRAFWGHDRAEEKVAFEAFIDFVMARWQAYPDMHVYHYAAYERGRMGTLSTRHATREAEVDKMLTAELFVDLYKVVRQSMRIGLDSYSIKTPRAAVRARPGGAAEGRRLIDRGLRALHPLGERRHAGYRHPGRDPALQPGRLPLERGAPGLAGSDSARRWRCSSA